MNDSDKELLELAAKAAGYEFKLDKLSDGTEVSSIRYEEDNSFHSWNPLENDGDAFRLLVILSLETYVVTNEDGTLSQYVGYSKKSYDKINYMVQSHGIHPYEATRRAIIRAAAEIGKTK